MTTDRSHLTPNQVTGYLAGALAPAERAEVLSHLDRCATCRAELIDVGGVAAEVRPPSGPARRPRPRLVPAALALAAGMAAIAVYRGRESAGDTVIRTAGAPDATEGIPGIAVVGPADGTVVADSVVLRWRSGSGSYDVLLLEEDGRPLWSITTPDTVVRVPATVALRPGATYFWRVDAMGNGIVASTGVRRLTVAR